MDTGVELSVETNAHPARRATMAALFSGVGLGATSYIAALTVAGLIAEDLLGSTTWSGLPNSIATVGRATGTAVLSAVMLRWGRRTGLMAGYFLSAGAALVAAAGAVVGSFPLFLLGMFVFGVGYGSNLLARYAAADLYPAILRSSAIGWVVWAGTIGSVAGPALLAPSRDLVLRFGLPGLTGAFGVACVASALAGGVIGGRVRPDWLQQASPDAAGISLSQGTVREWLTSPAVRIAVLSMVIGQAVMVLLMAMTPIYIRAAQQGLGSVGLAMSAHTLGMFALSPVSGWFSDRFGRYRAILAACACLLASAFLAVFANGDQVIQLSVSVFLLGLGWNLAFVAGSALLTESVSPQDRIRAQGMADALAWMTGAAASFSSGLLLSAWGFSALSLIGGLLALLPALALLRQSLRRAGESEAPL